MATNTAFAAWLDGIEGFREPTPLQRAMRRGGIATANFTLVPTWEALVKDAAANISKDDVIRLTTKAFDGKPLMEHEAYAERLMEICKSDLEPRILDIARSSFRAAGLDPMFAEVALAITVKNAGKRTTLTIATNEHRTLMVERIEG